MIQCEFCTEFGDSGDEQVKAQTLFRTLFPDQPNRILLQTDHFLVVPGLGQISEGYLLVITKSHSTSMAEIPSALDDELQNTIEICCSVLSEVYGNPCAIFEHGGSKVRKGPACCVDHAHVHLLPLDANIWPLVDTSQGGFVPAARYP